jgi:hypothetical protein
VTRTKSEQLEAERRPDGWPLCPVCGEDELGDLQHWDARPFGHLFCYRCVRFYEIAPAKPAPAPLELVDAPLAGDDLVSAVERLRTALMR